MNPKSNTCYCPRILLLALSYILYRINIAFGIIFSSLLDNVKAASTSKKNGIYTAGWGQNTTSCCSWGASKGNGWGIAFLAYMLKEALEELMLH